MILLNIQIVYVAKALDLAACKVNIKLHHDIDKQKDKLLIDLIFSQKLDIAVCSSLCLIYFYSFI